MPKKMKSKVEQQNTQTNQQNIQSNQQMNQSNQQMNQSTNKQTSNATDYVTVPTQKKSGQAQDSQKSTNCR